MDFAIHIKSLLIASDRLCIPGLGTFITRYKPAEIVQGMNFIKPPSKEISFDPALKKDDTGILASYVAKQERLSIQGAYEKIRVFVDNITDRINNERNFDLPGIGTFSLKDGKMFFKPDVTGNLRAESYGLPDVSTSGEVIVKKPETVQRITQPASSSEIKKQAPPKVEVRKPATEIKKAEPVAVRNNVQDQSVDGRWIMIGIAVPVIAVLICIFLVLPNSDSFSGLFSAQEITVTTESDTSFESNITDVEKYIDTAASQNTALKFEDEEKAVPETKTKAAADDKYAHCKNFYIVAGSFKNMWLAAQYKSKLRSMGYDAEILVKGDTNRVYIKKFDNREEALKDLEQLQASGMNVWLLSQ